jgi:hypothetical protein
MIILVFGYRSGVGATTTTFIGTSCTFIGNETGVTATTVEYSTAIGYAAKITDSNQMMLGIAATTVTIPEFHGCGNSCSINIGFNSPSTKRIILTSSSQWGIYLSAYNALTKSLNG